MVIGWFLVFGVACSPTVRVDSQPMGAVIELEDGEQLVTPTAISAPRWPFRRPQVTVRASGYRSLDARIPYASRDEWVIVLIPEHGPAGSWDEGDLP